MEEAVKALDHVALWPASETEWVANCPVCASPGRETLHTGLVDKAFGVAPGQWTLVRCLRCTACYLQSRPTPDSIGRAYSAYYTHAQASVPASGPVGGFRRLRRALGNGYLNERYGTDRSPSS